MAHRRFDEAGAMPPFAVIGFRSMTPAERARGRFMRAPDHDASTGGAAPADVVDEDPIKRIAAALGDDDGADDPDPNDPSDALDPDGGQGDPDNGDPDPNDPDADGEQAKPAIEPPVSWKAEMKPKFAELSPDVQEYILQRDSEASRGLQSKATEAAEARKAREQAEAAIHQLHSSYIGQLEQFLSTNEPQKPDPAWLNTSVYGEDGPRIFYQKQAEYEARHAQRQQAQQELSVAQQRQAALTEHQTREFMAEQHRILSGPEGIEGWADPAKQPEIAKALTDFATAHRYTAEQLQHVDAQDIKFLHEAMGWKTKAEKYDALQKQKMAVVRQAKELPKTARPNAPQPAGSAQARATQQTRERLKQSGSLQDAAALIEGRL